MSAPTSSGLTEAVVAQIRAERSANDIPKGELAKLVEIGPRTLTRYLNGEREMSFGLIEKFAAAFGLTVVELVARAEERLAKERGEQV